MADIPLTVTVPDAWVIKVLNAFNTVADTHITLVARGSGDPETEFVGCWDFRIDVKQAGETNIEFGERVLRELGKAVINMVDKAEDEQRYKVEIATIIPPASDVPAGVLL